MEFTRAIVWQRAMHLAKRIIIASRQLPRDQRFAMVDQMVRAAISVPSNIAEGWARESVREKAQFLAIAHGSLAELQTQVMLRRSVAWITPAESDALLDNIDHIGRMLTILRRHWRSKRPSATTR